MSGKFEIVSEKLNGCTVVRSSLTGNEYKLIHCASFKHGRMEPNSRRLVYLKGEPVCVGNFKDFDSSIIGIENFERSSLVR